MQDVILVPDLTLIPDLTITHGLFWLDTVDLCLLYNIEQIVDEDAGDENAGTRRGSRGRQYSYVYIVYVTYFFWLEGEGTRSVSTLQVLSRSLSIADGLVTFLCLFINIRFHYFFIFLSILSFFFSLNRIFSIIILRPP